MKTQITFILDSSGSMASIEADTKGGFNAFLNDQRHEEGEATVTLYEFSTGVECVYERVPIAEAPERTDANYTPRGRTALYDAISSAITATDSSLASDGPSDSTDNVIIVVLTDGKENASETSQKTVRTLVSERQERGWEFLFIGANQDAALTARSIGMDEGKALDMAHDGEGARAAYESTSDRVRNARQTGTTGDYTVEDRQRQNRSE